MPFLAKRLRATRIDTEVNNVPIDGADYNRRFLYSLLHIYQRLDCSLGPHPYPVKSPVSRWCSVASRFYTRVQHSNTNTRKHGAMNCLISAFYSNHWPENDPFDDTFTLNRFFQNEKLKTFGGKKLFHDFNSFLVTFMTRLWIL